MINGVITVRTTSSRLEKKCLLPFGNEESVLMHVVLRCRNNGIRPIVCTSFSAEDDIIYDICAEHKIDVFRGHPVNKLLRWHDCAKAFGLESFHTVDADDPFFDWMEMKRSMNVLKEGYDYIAPSLYSSGGGASVGYSIRTEILKEVISLVDEDTDTEMMWYLFDNIGDIKSSILPNSDSVHTLNFQLRLTLDYKEDYWLLNSLARILGNKASYLEIVNFLKKNPDFYRINSFRNDEWKNAQKAKGKTLQEAQRVSNQNR